jgi:hypothetical protein
MSVIFKSPYYNLLQKFSSLKNGEFKCGLLFSFLLLNIGTDFGGDFRLNCCMLFATGLLSCRLSTARLNRRFYPLAVTWVFHFVAELL